MKIKDIADELGVSIKYLSGEFKKEVGLTFLDALNRRRICKSIELNRTGKYTLDDIADKTGFLVINIFMQFLKISWCAPKEFGCM